MEEYVSKQSESELSISYPPKPNEPKESECCGSGCQVCVFDLYELDLKRWETICKRISSNQNGETPIADLISIYEFKEFRITKIEVISQSIKLFQFEIPNGGKFDMVCGQHLMARCRKSDGNYVVRPYTPVSSRKQEGSFHVAIKIYADGDMSACVSTWKVGSNIEWRGPFGEYRYFPNRHRKIVLLACGTGVAPMIQVMREVLENEDDDTVLHLFYSIQCFDDILVKDVLDSMTDYWNCHILYHVTKDSPASFESKKKYKDRIHYGRITGDKIQEEIGAANSSYQILVCGTKSFNRDMEKICSELGFDGNLIVKF